jgi:hypothetical protein
LTSLSQRGKKDLTSQFKPRPRGERAKGEIEQPKKLYGRRAR